MRYFIITYGCQMNKSDSERIAASLERKGYKPAQNPKDADLIVVNMCSVRQSAVDRVFGWPLKLKTLKTKNHKLKTILTGCILKKDKRKFAAIFDEIWDNRDYFNVAPKCQNKSLAYVPISNGCNNFCAYCVVPFARGKLVCRPYQDIIKEIGNLVKRGFKEIWLLGQNVNDYRSKTINFAKLAKMVNDLPGDFKFFFTAPHPKPSTRAKLGAGLVPHRNEVSGAGNFLWDELIDVLANCEKYGRYLNLPVQSGDNQILKKMNRPYTVKQYQTLVKKIRRAMPDINLSTDVIVGFPGETQKQFQNTVKLFKAIKFDIAYIAKYSPRPGTASFKMKDDVSLEEKKRRAKILSKLTKHG